MSAGSSLDGSPQGAGRRTVSRPAMLLAALLAAGFAVLASLHLGWLGPYYDEWIFVPVSLRFLGACDLDAAVGIAQGCLPLMQAPPYVGVIKAALMAPVFALFGVDAWSVRLPPILLTALVLWGTWRFLAPRLGALAFLALALMAIDPVLIEHVRFDWGPFVISNACKLLGLYALWRWLEQGRTRDLALAMALCLVGLVDKLSFVWIIIAYAAALAIALPDWLFARLKSLRPGAWAVLGVAALLMLWIAIDLILPAMRIKLPGFEQPLSLAERIARVVELYNLTFSGLALRRWVFGVDLIAPAWPALALCAVWSVSALSLVLHRANYRSDRGPLRLLGFCVVTVPVLFGLLVATREVGGSHHLVVLWPYPLLMLVALLRVWSVPLQRLTRGAPVALSLLVCTAVAFNSGSTYAQSLAYWRGEHGVHPYFDPGLHRVADALKRIDADRVVSTGWGLHQGLISLAPEERRPRYRDWTWTLQDPPSADQARTDWLWRTFLEGGSVAWLAWAPGLGLQDAQGHQRYLAAWPHCVRARETFPSAAGGDALIELYVLDFKAGCENSAARPMAGVKAGGITGP